MTKIYEKGNYLFIEQNDKTYSAFKNEVRIIKKKLSETIYDVIIFQDNLDIDWTNCLDETDTQFATIELFEEFFYENSGTSTESTEEMLVVLQNLLTELQLKADLTETQPVSLSGGLPGGEAGGATEATLLLIKAKTDLLTPAVRTHNTIVTSTTGTIASGSLRGSVLNSGNSSGVWNGITIPAGISIPWESVGTRDTYTSIVYDATDTTFVIEYTT